MELEGRANNLTEEQTQKLKHFWTIFLKQIGDPISEKTGINSTANKSSSSLNFFRKAEVYQFNSNELPLDFITLHLSETNELYKVFWETVQAYHPDDMLLRFLRARKWNPEKALEMITKALTFYKEMDVRKIKKEGENSLNLNMFEKGQVYFQGNDKKDLPIVYYPFHFIFSYVQSMKHDPKGQTIEEFGKILIWVMEAGSWALIKPLLDPVVTAKIFFVAQKEILTHIDEDQLIKRLRGKHPYDYKYLQPSKDENACKEGDDAKELESEYFKLANEFTVKTADWIKSDDIISDERNDLAKKINSVFRELMPYVKARTFYHRIGAVDEEGRVDWSNAK